MKPITPQQFLLRQPAFPDAKASDIYYFELTNKLLADWADCGALPTLDDDVMQRAALCVVGYYQDIISDAGLWRAFINECHRMYGRYIPFHDTPEDYVVYELNYIDIAFLLWYVIAMLDMDHRDIYPHHPDLLRLADVWHRRLEESYDDAPTPEEYNIGFQLDVYNTEDSADLLKLSTWLFRHSYLLTPSFAITLAQIAQQARVQEPDGEVRLNDMLDEAMAEQPIGPLALYLREWVFLILHDSMPPAVHEPAAAPDTAPHKYYTAVTTYTGGRNIAYFADYMTLNKFFIEVLGWEQGHEHLPQFKHHSDFVVQVDPVKGMLLARNVAKCIADPDNPLYNAAYARTHAFDLLTVRGLCPPDLLATVLKNDWLPEARFPMTDDTRTVHDNADFIARCFLQLFYRGD